MTSIINNFEITNDFTITDGNVQIKTVDTTGSLDVSGNIIIGSASSDNAKLIVKNINNSIVELKAKNSNNIETTKSITNKSGVLEFTSNASLNTCLYEFNVGDSDSIGFMNSTGNNKPGIVFGRAGTDSLSVNNYSNAHIFYSTVDGGSVNNALNFTGEKLIFNTSSGNFSTLSQAMIIDSTSNIGMGTASPSVSLDVIGTDAIRIPYGTTAQRPQTDASGCIRYNTQTSSYEGFGAGSQWGSLGGVKDVDQDTYISAETTAGTDNDQLKFYTEGTERMIIDKNGRVGIGISSPNQALHVIGSIQATSNITTTTFFGNVIADTINGTITTAAQSNITSVGTLTSLTLSGNVGIGTSSTSVPLEVHRTGPGDIAKFSRTGSMDLVINGDNGNCNFLVKSGTGINIAVDSSLPQYNSTKGIFIKNDGDVGIGTNNPGAKLYVSGNIKTTDRLEINSHGNAFQITGGHNPTKGLKFFTSGSYDYADFLNLDFVRIGSDGNSCELRVVGDQRFFFGSHDYCYIRNRSGQNRPHGQLYLYYGYVDGGERNTGVFLSASPYESNYINNGGNVGIGTDNPGAKLEVSGDVRIGYIAGSKDGLLLSNSHTTGIYSNSPFIQGLTHSFGTNNIALNPNGGNVGIGTNNPSMRLTVKAQNREISIGDTGSNNVGQIICHETGNSSNVSYLRIRAYGIQCYTYSNNRYIDIEKGDEINSSNDLFLQYSNGRNIYLCSGGGDVFVNQSIQITSDDRLKHNEIVIDNALETINKLTAKKYFKTQEMYEPDKNFDFDAFGNLIDDDGNKLKYRIETGFIAQEVQKISELKYLVKNCDEVKDIFEDKKDENGNIIYEKDGSGNNTEIPEQVSVGKKKMPLTLNYQDIFVLNVQATQEIHRELQVDKLKIVASEAKIVASEAKIVAAEAKIAASETEINTLKNDNAVLLNKIATLESNFYNLQQQVQTLIDNQ